MYVNTWKSKPIFKQFLEMRENVYVCKHMKAQTHI